MRAAEQAVSQNSLLLAGLFPVSLPFPFAALAAAMQNAYRAAAFSPAGKLRAAAFSFVIGRLRAGFRSHPKFLLFF
ncbi:MAG: hypothetical protein ACL93V_00725 [Candidatus Electrothrix sp. YB6]